MNHDISMSIFGTNRLPGVRGLKIGHGYSTVSLPSIAIAIHIYNI